MPIRDEMPDRQLTEELRSYLRSEKADLVGFGTVDRIEGAPEIMRPQRYLPDARSMVSIAVHVNEAVCDLIARSARQNTAPPSYHSFQMFTLAAVNPVLDQLAFLGAKFLEDRGYRAYPFPANVPHRLAPSELYPGGPGDISHKHVAVACGLGTLGWHTMLITPQFATRQKLVSIVTNASLSPDPMMEQALCNPDVCGAYCAEVCPMKAIPADTQDSVSCVVGDKTVKYARLVGWRCRWGCSGMIKATGGYLDIPIPDTEPNAEELNEYRAQMDPWQQRMVDVVGLIPYCGKCISVCCGNSTCKLH